MPEEIKKSEENIIYKYIYETEMAARFSWGPGFSEARITSRRIWKSLQTRLKAPESA